MSNPNATQNTPKHNQNCVYLLLPLFLSVFLYSFRLSILFLSWFASLLIGFLCRERSASGVSFNVGRQTSVRITIALFDVFPN